MVQPLSSTASSALQIDCPIRIHPEDGRLDSNSRFQHHPDGCGTGQQPGLGRRAVLPQHGLPYGGHDLHEKLVGDFKCYCQISGVPEAVRMSDLGSQANTDGALADRFVSPYLNKLPAGVKRFTDVIGPEIDRRREMFVQYGKDHPGKAVCSPTIVPANHQTHLSLTERLPRVDAELLVG
jgi:hypothetical protein